jgi:hypothetical protein
MKENGEYKFTCSSCGDHELVVTHAWNVLAGPDSERWQEWGPLKENHHWQYKFKEKVEEDEENEHNEDKEDREEDEDREVQRGDFSDFEDDDSDSEPEEYEKFESEADPESDEYFVNCGNCNREIEFGWSKPDQRGLIFPVEFSDFTPVESWPDPKYVDAWEKRGWLRSKNIHS